MIPLNELGKMASARIEDAEVLQKGKRYDGAVYLCGYSVELVLKASICRTLKWKEFPSTNKEFEGLHSFKTHKLDLLLHLSGFETKIKTSFFTDWSIVAAWDPESRYSLVGTVSDIDASNMIESAKIIIKALG
jgi:HEPN domain